MGFLGLRSSPQGGQKQQHSTNGHPSYYPMQNYRGLSAIPNPARNNGEDIDNTPRQFRRWVNASGLQDVQIGNGLRNGIAHGVINIGVPSAWLKWDAGTTPIIPGQTRGDVGGFHQRGPSPYNVQNMINATAGSQPTNPGGPGVVVGRTLINPMSGLADGGSSNRAGS